MYRAPPRNFSASGLYLHHCRTSYQVDLYRYQVDLYRYQVDLYRYQVDLYRYQVDLSFRRF